MSEKQEPYITASITAIKITYTDDVPDVRDYLIDLRRDLLRKVKQLDELIARIPQAKPPT
jgi:hypothetical protein